MRGRIPMLVVGCARRSFSVTFRIFMGVDLLVDILLFFIALRTSQ